MNYRQLGGSPSNIYFAGFNLRRSKEMLGYVSRYTMWKNLKKGVYFGDLHVIRKIILKGILRK